MQCRSTRTQPQKCSKARPLPDYARFGDILAGSIRSVASTAGEAYDMRARSPTRKFPLTSSVEIYHARANCIGLCRAGGTIGSIFHGQARSPDPWIGTWKVNLAKSTFKICVATLLFRSSLREFSDQCADVPGFGAARFHTPCSEAVCFTYCGRSDCSCVTDCRRWALEQARGKFGSMEHAARNSSSAVFRSLVP